MCNPIPIVRSGWILRHALRKWNLRCPPHAYKKHGWKRMQKIDCKSCRELIVYTVPWGIGKPVSGTVWGTVVDMKKTQTSQVQSEHLLSGHTSECIVSRTAFFNDAIPKELKTYSQWIFWKLEQRDGRLIKVPMVRGYRFCCKKS